MQTIEECGTARECYRGDIKKAIAPHWVLINAPRLELQLKSTSRDIQPSVNYGGN
ncbi:hypothetical protein [Kamptonema sp. UHCC 0994]|uniref:hypothetical protein n=1 Tax=Kamptonema sp. UHCC 0994 TaxID=3031329 RepID=UPI0023B9793C|nr:hypothetical protein [Kamptonema sp. UHCC 0994]MDF0552574.1 hypothetical protein [Kamptonema sp. UHCC 0994]